MKPRPSVYYPREIIMGQEEQKKGNKLKRVIPMAAAAVITAMSVGVLGVGCKQPTGSDTTITNPTYTYSWVNIVGSTRWVEVEGNPNRIVQQQQQQEICEQTSQPTGETRWVSIAGTEKDKEDEEVVDPDTDP
ncbi:MAG: hypothetical protein LBB98_00730, partial [Treponema sp.]|nr:hypothetical protein [Treponema sp.]